MCRLAIFVERCVEAITRRLEKHGGASEIGPPMPHVIIEARATLSDEPKYLIANLSTLPDMMFKAKRIIPTGPVFCPKQRLIRTPLAKFRRRLMDGEPVDRLKGAGYATFASESRNIKAERLHKIDHPGHMLLPGDTITLGDVVILVLHLNNNDVSPLGLKMGNDYGHQHAEIAAHPVDVRGVPCPKGDSWFIAQPERITAVVPFRATIGPHAKNHLDPLFTAERKKSIKIGLIRKIINAPLRLMDVPKDISGHAIHARGFRRVEKSAPFGAGNSRIVDFTRNDEHALPIDNQGTGIKRNRRHKKC